MSIVVSSSLTVRLRRVFRAALRRRITYIAALFITVAVINALLFYYFEGWRDDVDLATAFYWSVITMATIGYGDVTPVTWAGRVLAMEAAVVGITAFTIVVSVIAEEFISRTTRKMMGLGKLKRIDILVVGDSDACREAIREVRLNIPHAEIGWLMPEPPKQPPKDIEFVAGDIDDDDTLKRARADKISNIIICYRDDSKALHAVLALRRVNKKARIVALTGSSKTAEFIKEAGADFVVPAKILGRVAASAIFEPSVAHFINDVTSATGLFDLIEHVVTESEDGRSVREVVSGIGASGLRLIPVAVLGEEGLRPVLSEDERVRKGERVIILKAVASKRE